MRSTISLACVIVLVSGCREAPPDGRGTRAGLDSLTERVEALERNRAADASAEQLTALVSRLEQLDRELGGRSAADSRGDRDTTPGEDPEVKRLTGRVDELARQVQELESDHDEPGDGAVAAQGMTNKREIERTQRAVNGIDQDVSRLTRRLDDLEQVAGRDRLSVTVQRLERTVEDIERQLDKLEARVRRLESRG